MHSEQQALFTLDLGDEVSEGIIDQITTPAAEPTFTEIEVAIGIMQHHLEKEARNRQIEMIAPEDLCPTQKRELVRDMARLLRG